jgi:(E)-4-hydroxy-3-methylbut-2-enyl-diphosphate synthase
MIVKIGKLKIGEEHPVLIQSMTNTDTNDIDASVEQCIRIAAAGGQMIRLTVQGLKEVESLMKIRRLLFEKGYNFPLIADVHFNPRVAEEAAKVVEKVRINPGNYTDKNHGKKINFSEEEYQEGVNTIHEKLKPLLEICKERKTALRIGVNHGSLSDRIMSRYGDTPEGMAESAMEFIRICKAEKFFNLVISMKSSNTRIMTYACRILLQKMEKEDSIFPLHLGVTEAGEGLSGRVKSSVGIAALLQQGIGDTIRVSLTEDPEDEIPVGIEIANYFSTKKQKSVFIPQPANLKTSFIKRNSYGILNIGGSNCPVVIDDLNTYHPNPGDNSRIPDYLYTETKFLPVNGSHPNLLIKAELFDEEQALTSKIFPIGNPDECKRIRQWYKGPFFLLVNAGELETEYSSLLKLDKSIILVVQIPSTPSPFLLNKLFSEIESSNLNTPVIIKKVFNCTDLNKMELRASGETGIFFLDGLADGIWLSNPIKPQSYTNLCFEILQAARVRTTITEYIACPSCGRTLFDIKSILLKVKEETKHLKGLKIAVMGCIVNGPGEMADADYGYVGSGFGRVSLYRGKKLVRKNVPEEDAISRLIELIQEDGKWS